MTKWQWIIRDEDTIAPRVRYTYRFAIEPRHELLRNRSDGWHALAHE